MSKRSKERAEKSRRDSSTEVPILWAVPSEDGYGFVTVRDSEESAKSAADTMRRVVGARMSVDQYVRAEPARAAICLLADRVHALESLLRECLDEARGLYRQGFVARGAPMFSAEEEAALCHAIELTLRCRQKLSRQS
jgi:hypothetical protein